MVKVALSLLTLCALACVSETEEYWGGTVGGYEAPQLQLEFLADAAERKAVTDMAGRLNARGPFDHPEDGRIFEDKRGVLPPMPAGYYREYTVPTPNIKGRGHRRLIQGEGGELFYTRDGGASARRLVVIPR